MVAVGDVPLSLSHFILALACQLARPWLKLELLVNLFNWGLIVVLSLVGVSFNR